MQFDVVTDVNYEFAIELGFVNVDEGTIYRGYAGVNPETQTLIKEIDYLVGENVQTIAENMQEL
ncbi:hypothetical protein J2S74_002651 [Evansella vedderi]|uniref:Uncharacterized protein n=1 Tax=Evansella vedderi TaxID=38282 RepID=A0ABT9ZVK3_9BACI|nr:hypothetical protein [Evansella vedderi]